MSTNNHSDLKVDEAAQNAANIIFDQLTSVGVEGTTEWFKEVVKQAILSAATELRLENDTLRSTNQLYAETMSIQNQKDNPLHVKIGNLQTRIENLEEALEIAYQWITNDSIGEGCICDKAEASDGRINCSYCNESISVQNTIRQAIDKDNNYE